MVFISGDSRDGTLWGFIADCGKETAGQPTVKETVKTGCVHTSLNKVTRSFIIIHWHIVYERYEVISNSLAF